MIVTIVDYGAGNLRSAAKAFAIAGAKVVSDLDLRVSGDPDDVLAADLVILPGDGAFPDCRAGLSAVAGMDEALEETVRRRGRPFLGICVGMQLLVDTGTEYRTTAGLGWIPGACVHIEPADKTLKVPHMGWNTLRPHRRHALLDGIPLGDDGLHAFFLHAFQVLPRDPADVLADADYGGPVTAVLARGNVAGVQFHPEKSQRLGLALVENVLKWRP
jgi:glutamine amidotransferase